MSENNESKEEIKEKGEKPLNWTKIIILGLLSLALILTVFMVTIKLIGDSNYDRFIKYFDEHYGRWGIFLYVFIVDTLILPLSPDFAFPVAIAYPWWQAIPIIGIASALGGLVSYCVGRLLVKVKFINKLSEKARDKWGKYIDKFGIWFIIISGIAPLPFSTITMAAGAVKLSSKKVVPACFIRLARTALYYYLFTAGFAIL